MDDALDNVVVGALLGTSDSHGGLIDISSSFQMVIKMSKEGDKKSENEYTFDTEYLKKMLKFHKQVNDSENILGVYISSPKIDKVGINIVKYMV